jgi:hypothetical protein
MDYLLIDIPEAATLPDALRDHLPDRRSVWVMDGWRVLILAWTAAEWAAIPHEDRPADASPLGDMVCLLVILGRVDPAS